MCGSMADIQSAAAEIRRGKKKEERTNHSMKIYMVSLLHRATIKNIYFDDKILCDIGLWMSICWYVHQYNITSVNDR